MAYGMTVKKAKELEAEVYVLTPQHPTGLLLVHTIAELEVIDDGKWIEVTTEDARRHLVSPDDRVLVVFDSQLKGVGMKTKKRSIVVEEGMERLASFIKDTHGAQDWENTVYTIQDYLAAFIGVKAKGVYQDLMERMKETE